MDQKPIIHLIAAARPNFMKVAPLYHELIRQAWCKPLLVHTGQHYDESMSGNILRDLGLPEPDIHLGVGSGTHVIPPSTVFNRVVPAVIMAVEASKQDTLFRFAVVPLDCGVQPTPPSNVRRIVPISPTAQPVKSSAKATSIKCTETPLV